MVKTEEKKLVPALRFPEFEGEWVESKFIDIFQFSSGKNIKQNEASPEFEIPCVRYGELYHLYNEVIYTTINKTNLDKVDLRFSEGDEILLPSAGEDPLDIGSASALTIKNVAIGRTINILRPIKDSVYSQIFVAFYINHKLRKKIATLAKGVSISNVYNSDLKTLNLNLPSLPEQQKNASFLTAIDKRIQALEKKKSLLEQYKNGVMQGLFRRPLSELGSEGLKDDRMDNGSNKKNNPKILKSHKSQFRQLRFKDENGQDFPEWEEKKLGEVFTFLNTNSFSRDKLNYVSGNVFNIHYGDIHTKFKSSFKINSEKVPHINNEVDLSRIQSNNYCREGDLVIADASEDYLDIGKSIELIELDGKKVLAGLHTFLARPKDQTLYKGFASHLMKSIVIRKQIMTIAQGTKVLGISKGRLSKITLYIPSLPEQTHIANFLTTLDKKIAGVDQQIEKTKAYKQGLLQKMFV